MHSLSFIKDNSRSSKVKKNVVGSFAVKGISIVISLLLVPLTIGYVSSELYGIWLTLVTVISWVGLFDLGFGNGLRNRVAECIALEDWQKARSYISTAYVYFTLIFVPVALLFNMVCGYIDWPTLLNVSVEYQALLVKVMRIVIVFFALNMVVKIQSTVLASLQLNALSGFFDMISQVVILIATYILTITTEPSLVFLAWVISASPVVVSLLVSLWLYGIKYRKLCPSLLLVDKSLVGSVMNLGVKFFIIQIAVLVLYQTINVIISNVAGPESVTEYNVVYRYISLPLMATSMVVAPFWSAFTDAYTLKDYDWMQRSYGKLMKMVMLALAVLVLLIAFYPIFFKYWIGDKVEVHHTMVVVVAVYVFIMIWNNIHSALINGTGKITLTLYSTIVCIVFNIPLAFALGRLWGAAGVIASVSLMNLLGFVLMRIQIKKIIYNRAIGIWNK